MKPGEAFLLAKKLGPHADGWFYVPEDVFFVLASYTKSWHGEFAFVDRTKTQKLDAVQMGWLLERGEMAVVDLVANTLENSL